MRANLMGKEYEMETNFMEKEYEMKTDSIVFCVSSLKQVAKNRPIRVWREEIIS